MRRDNTTIADFMENKANLVIVTKGQLYEILLRTYTSKWSPCHY